MISKVDITRKLQHERRVVHDMITLYCRNNHGTTQLCDECRELAEYADERTRKCPFMEQKSFCSQCKIHCYKPQMREKIRQVMRYSGPRMIFHHPIAAIRHLYYTQLEKLNSNK
ncbi:MAG: nitrous oxide-stimulated promoter family protein [Alistipes sp.]|nr:nitrous oxide-stimulated promoter family protein [Alistipes sp.]